LRLFVGKSNRDQGDRSDAFLQSEEISNLFFPNYSDPNRTIAESVYGQQEVLHCRRRILYTKKMSADVPVLHR